MKKYIFFLAAILIPMTLWSQKPTHTLTTESPSSNWITVNTEIKGDYVRDDTVRIIKYQLEEGETYTVSVDKERYSGGNVRSYFVEWLLDGVSYSTSPTIQLTMGKSDMHLTAVVEYTTDVPYSPVANWFEPATGILTLDEIRYGSIESAIKMSHIRYNFERDDVLSIIVKGEVGSLCFDNFYWVFFGDEALNPKPWNNLNTIDMSQTDMKSVADYTLGIYDNSKYLPALEHVILGPNTQTIGDRAFRGLNIKKIDCYAVTPPSCRIFEYNAYTNSYSGSFSNMNVPFDEVVVRVPQQSVDLYKAADGWKDFPNIQPLDNLGSVLVTIPTDVAEGYYDDMTVEVTDLRSNASQSLSVLNKRYFQFGGLMRGNEYQAVLKNAYGQVMGQSDPAELGVGDLTLTISNLLRKKDVSIKVTDPDGTDVTGKVRIQWTDESGKTLGYGSQLKAVAEGAKLNCKVSLNGELAQQYVAPGAVPITVDGEGENLLTAALQPIQPMTLHGQVKDLMTGEGIADATVTLIQQGISLGEIVSATTDEDGMYELEGTNGAGELSVTATLYVPTTAEFAMPEADGTLPLVEMDPFNGIIVYTLLTYTEAVKEGEESKVNEDYDDESGDVTLQIYNLNKNTFVKDFIQRGNALYLSSGVDTGDNLMITASSRTKSFSDVSEVCQIDDNGRALVTLSIMQQGGLEAVRDEENIDRSNPAMGVLYDSDGRYVRSNRYSFNTLSFSGLASGYYTLVSMSYNYLMRRVLLLSTLDDMGLVEGTDYVKNTVHVQDGRIATVNVADVPVLDTKKTSFTDSGTYFIADKNIVCAGQSVIFRSKVSFMEQFAERISKAEFIVDLPEGTEFVENSAMTGSTFCSYRLENGHYVFSLDNIGSDILRFSVATKQAGYFYISGSVRFTMDGVQIVQPVGTVYIQADGVTINEPGFVPPSTLRLSGTAPVGCESVSIYDNDRLTGMAKVKANGTWSISIKITNDVSHAVKARMSTSGTEAVVESETRHLDRLLAEKVIMKAPHSPHLITFNYFENTVNPKSYKYILNQYWDKQWQGDWMVNIPYSTKFTFVTYFAHMDPSKVGDVKIKVLASDGTARTLDAEYDENLQGYYASTEYPNSSKIPVSAYAYTYKRLSKEDVDARIDALGVELAKITRATINAVNQGEFELLLDEEETFKFRFTPNGKDPFDFTVKQADYDETWAYTMENAPFYYCTEKDTLVYTLVDGEEEAEAILINVMNHSAWRMVITGAEMGGLGAKSNKRNGPRKISGKDILVDILEGVGIGAGLGTSFGLNITGMEPYLEFTNRVDHMSDEIKSTHASFYVKWGAAAQLLEIRANENCGREGDYRPRITDDEYDDYRKRLDKYIEDYKLIMDQLDEIYYAFENAMITKVEWDGGWILLDIVTGKVSETMKFNHMAFRETKIVFDQYVKANAAKWAVSNVGGAVLDFLKGGADPLIGADTKGLIAEFDDKVNLHVNSMLKALDETIAEINFEDCEEEEEPEPDDENDDEKKRAIMYDDSGDKEAAAHNSENGGRSPFSTPVKPLIDPQGYVYEAVPSNRVEGATAVIYYKSGDTDVMWDAENYDQENPQITGSDGMYQWDVPQGQWQVRVQKEGYQNAASEWLPVPPPQLDVNIPIVRSRLPKVEKAHAYVDAVTVKFDTYMLPALLTTEQITVKENGTAVEGVISLTDEEEAPDGAVYASQLRFVPATPFTATEVTLIVSGEVKNYAGIGMEPYEAVLPIEGEVKNLEAEPAVEIDYQSTGTIRVKGTPANAAAGKKVKVTCMSGIVASAAQTEVVLDANGEADVTIEGGLPGEEIVTFTMDDPALTTSTLVKVVTELPLVIEAPEASVATETEVAKGAEITLTCKTEGAAIYYTLDGSSPLDSDTRILYDGTPVVINAETTLAAVAVIDGKGSSEVRTWHYTVSVETRTEEVSGSSMQVTPARVRDSFVVTGVEGAFSLRVYSMSGKLLLTLEQVRSGQRVDASALPAGIHLVVVNTPAASFTRRIIKY